MDDPAILTGVARERGEWMASRGADISIRQEPVSLEAISTLDVVLFSGQRMGDLVDAGVLATIPNGALLPPKAADTEDGDRREANRAEESRGDTFLYMDIAPAYRDQVTRYGSLRLALSCGGSALVLAYRRDAFERETNLAAARLAGLSLKPPATWAQLDALAKFFQGRDWNGDGAPDYGIALAFAPDAEGLGNATFLARAASLGQHRDHYSFLFDPDTMTPRIDTPPFIEALQALSALKACGPPTMERFDAEGARQSFKSGKVAMLIDRAERAALWSHNKPIAVAPLPGSERVFEPVRKVWEEGVSPPNSPSYLPKGGGWLIGINRALSSTQLDAAVDFAKYLASPENSARIRAERSFPMLPVRTSQMGQGLPEVASAPDVDSRAWSDAVSRTLLAERVVPGLRIAGAAGYLHDLGLGRAAALAGQAPKKALHGVAQAWAKRTKERGQERERWHYQQSLNSLATLPRPPEPGK
jgi:multiple sugar transport system substrate-binding protein